MTPSISSVEVSHYPLTIHVDYLCNDTRMITYESSGDYLYNSMVDYGDSFDDCEIVNSTYCNHDVGFELSFPRCGIGVYLDNISISFSVNSLLLKICFDHMLILLLVYN